MPRQQMIVTHGSVVVGDPQRAAVEAGVDQLVTVMTGKVKDEGEDLLD